MTGAAIDFARIVRPGDTVMWGQGAAEPLTLIETLLEQRHRIGPFRVFVAGSYSSVLRPEHLDIVTVAGLGAVGANRALCRERAMDLYPVHVSQLPVMLASGAIEVDVVLLQLARGGNGEGASLGAASAFAQHAIPRARTVVAEYNSQAPWTHTSRPFDERAVIASIETNRALPEIISRPRAEEDDGIARQAAALIDDGVILQTGIGGVPGAVLRHLHDRRALGFHGGVLGDDALALVASGAADNSTKSELSGISVTNALAGSRAVYDHAHRNPAIQVEPSFYTHGAAVLAALPRLHAINSAIEVDLTGQVGSEVAGGAYVGTVGGAVDFARGAMASPGGRSIIALPSTAGKHGSRIVSQLRSGVVTIGRADADTVVTEHGVAKLRGVGIAERVRRMIAIAAPEHRDALEREARSATVGYWT